MIKKESFLPWWYLEKKKANKIKKKVVLLSIIFFILTISFSINIYLKNQLTELNINADYLIKDKKNKYMVYKDNLTTNLRELQSLNNLLKIGKYEEKLRINISGTNVTMEFYSNDYNEAKNVLIKVEEIFQVTYYSLNEIDEKIYTELKMVGK
jgi:hypothetical protein